MAGSFPSYLSIFPDLTYKTPALCKRPEPKTGNLKVKESQLPSSAPSPVTTTSATSAVPRASSTRPAACTVGILFFVVADWRGPALKLDTELLRGLAHV